MTDPFESVVGLLQEEADLHGRLLELAREEQRALVRGDVAGLQRLVAEQEKLVGQVRVLEQARRQLLELVAQRAGCPVDRLTLQELVQLSPPDVGRRLAEQREILTQRLRELADVNKANALLIRSHLEHVQAVISLVTRAAGGGGSLAVDRWA